MRAGVILLALGLGLVACGGQGPPAESSPVATFPSAPPPTPTVVVATVAPATPTPTPSPSPTPVAVTPVTPFEITVSEAVNIRAAPTTQAAIVGAIYPGERRRVVGEAAGQEVEPGRGNVWYAVEGGGFVYSPLVQRVR
ncbi:MAG TPA: SH3 domain-containing protein [Dehalococcoidia bacterium]|nr:SH3 domain-containing protein [Dehalococcoidia bacterium]